MGQRLHQRPPDPRDDVRSVNRPLGGRDAPILPL
ncbi:hypothetical protein S-PM2d239 [Synechococcus phage S-PM2]|uniref:Hypothetical-Protein / belonging to T4-LIKE GC: 816 n=1 Tax=Synechococcus phage S-PM2 TaxID=238854 RepID=D8FRM9_BPSYP|nr:Hypothetical-Protein / belonging to T4-LIKE GC: 816 [Synechococcus phage S-PM2]CBR26936.1 Hypothetical-Protein / belonging to T4-LIKE GC: 816 [Synechococcus phage S-PM2]CFW42192.1 hypothetical protein S-PM2d239 [Synechococcus phage S-PM2]